MFRIKPKTAAEWIIRLNAGQISDNDQRALVRWLTGRPDRLKELESSHLLWKIAGRLDGSPTAQSYLMRDLEEERRWPAWVRNKFFRDYFLPVSVAAAIVAIGLVAAPQITRWLSASYLWNGDTARTNLNQIATYTLPDDSVLTLAAASSVRISFTRKQRLVFLDRGEGFFDVRHIPGRPFIVTTGNKRVVVTGTKFNVDYHQSERAIEVAVIEGRINVISHKQEHGKKDVTSVGTHEVFLFPASGSAIREPLSAEHACAWRMRKLYFDDATLKDVLSSVNRYFQKPLVVRDPQMEKLTISGMFQAGDIKSVLLSLNDLYGLKGYETRDKWLLVQDKQPVRYN